MRRRRKKRPDRRAAAGAVILVIIIILIIASLAHIEKAVRPAAQMQAEHYSRLTANEIISSAVADYLEQNQYTYNDFAAVLYDESGRAASVEAVTYNINRVQSELSLMINTSFKEAGDTSAEIPLGSLTDSYLLAGKGPHVRLRICPAREATVELTSTFTFAGVNQTCHRISAVVTADIDSSIPLYSFESQEKFEFLLAENVIVGEVPERTLSVWRNSDEFSNN